MFDFRSYTTLARAIVQLLQAATYRLLSARADIQRGSTHPDGGADNRQVPGNEQRRRLASTINHEHRRKHILAMVVIAVLLLVVAGVVAANW